MRPSTLGYPSTKFYYFNENGGLVNSYKLPTFMPEHFLYMEVKVIEDSGDVKKLYLTPYVGDTPLGSTKVTIPDYDVRDAGRRMHISVAVLRAIRDRLSKVRKSHECQPLLTRFKSNPVTLEDRMYKEYYKTDDTYPYKSRLLTTAQKKDPEFMQRIRWNELIGLERKKKSVKPKPKRKVCRCKK